MAALGPRAPAIAASDCSTWRIAFGPNARSGRRAQRSTGGAARPRACAARSRTSPRAVLRERLGQERLAHDLVEHQVEQVVLRLDERVEAHRADAEVGRRRCGSRPPRSPSASATARPARTTSPRDSGSATRARPRRWRGSRAQTGARPLPIASRSSRHPLAFVQCTSYRTPYDDRTPYEPARHLRRGPRQALRRKRALRGVDLDVPRDGLRAARSQRRGQDHRRPDAHHTRCARRGQRSVAGHRRGRASRRGTRGASARRAGRDGRRPAHRPRRTSSWSAGSTSRAEGRGREARADELLERFDLTDAADRPAKTYSGGMRRRLDLAASLVARPQVLFLDEPTTGLDPRSRNELWDVIRDLVGRRHDARCSPRSTSRRPTGSPTTSW